MAFSSATPEHTLLAVVHSTQVVTTGATIKLRLLDDARVGENLISKGSFLYGTGTISNERLTIRLTHINYRNQVIPVSVAVYDLDGIEGIYVPGALEREVSKESTDQAIQSVNLNSYNPTVSGQLTSAGIQATKSLLSKKVKTLRVTIKAGHRVLLQQTDPG